MRRILESMDLYVVCMYAHVPRRDDKVPIPTKATIWEGYGVWRVLQVELHH